MRATTEELYRRLLRLHLEPTFGDQYVNAISPAKVRTWRAERRKATGRNSRRFGVWWLRVTIQRPIRHPVTVWHANGTRALRGLA
ncbi:hypothetical protein ACFWFZ_33820 [Streptomyces sp. NPDC060232]|uniref:hypothetical protein n=1 Tax=Streptomyces sp. NPDC060232 TaxID=3347079 RepID=UPI003665E847